MISRTAAVVDVLKIGVAVTPRNVIFCLTDLFKMLFRLLFNAIRFFKIEARGIIECRGAVNKKTSAAVCDHQWHPVAV